MAIGDKDPVVMQSDRAVPGGIATLGTNGKLTDGQLPDVARPGGVSGGKELTESWASLREQIRAGDFTGINIGDYKRITLATGEPVVMEVAGIDTYYKCGETVNIGHHVDFISRDCLSLRENYNHYGTNNGTEEEHWPWRASLLFQKLNGEVYAALPEDLKGCLIQKRANLETRIGNENSWAWCDMGYLWLPTEIEVFGHITWGQINFGAGGGCNTQYPLFAGSVKHVVKGDGSGNPPCMWWLASITTDNEYGACIVGYDGSCAIGAISGDLFKNYMPLCFRIG